MSQMPEFSSVERSAEEDKRATVTDTIDRVLIDDADAAEKRVSSNPNVTAFKGWEERAIPMARLDAMNDRMITILKDLLGDSQFINEDGLKQIAGNYVSRSLSRQLEQGDNRRSLESQFK